MNGGASDAEARGQAREGAADRRVDIVIVGSGIAGSLLAKLLADAGRSVLLVERSRHPRFALGESSTPLAALVLERLARRYRWPALADLATYGRWSRRLGHLRRGLKRGFTFYGHRPGEVFDPAHRLLVAASPDDELADAHWLREDVDAWLVAAARRSGVEVWEETRLESAHLMAGVGGAGDIEDDANLILELVGPDGSRRVRAAFAIDAAGGALARSLGVPSLPRSPSRLVYAHARGVKDFATVARHRAAKRGGTAPPWRSGPYPDHGAAIHHLVEEGWIYVLPFDTEDRVSLGWVRPAGAPAPPGAVAGEEPAIAFHRLLRRYPDLRASLEASVGASQNTGLGTLEPLRPFASATFRHRFERATGPGFALLPQAFCFADPMFSTGMAWSLLAVERLAAILTQKFSHKAGPPQRREALRRYDTSLGSEADQIETLVESAYAARHRFDFFTSVAFLYFATVSHQELRQRLVDGPVPAVPPLAPQHPAWRGFLGAGDAALREAFVEAHGRLHRGETEGFQAFIAKAIAPYNAIGLADRSRHNLYPVDLNTLRRHSHLLGLTSKQLEAALPRLRGGPR